MRHIVSLLVENESGALSRIAGLFSARGYNIESLTVATTEDPTLSRMTIITTGSDRIIEQITKQLNKLVDVVKLQDFTDGNYIEREMMFVKVKAMGRIAAFRSHAPVRHIPRSHYRCHRHYLLCRANRFQRQAKRLY